ncbi:hypothetical protein Q3C01_18235 [Bradyrhizobium sp. UFLA05-109]
MWLSIPIPFCLRLPNLTRQVRLLSRCVGEARLTINKASNLVQSLRQFQKTVNFDAAPQVLSGLQLSGSTSAPRFISFPLACCAGGQQLRDRRAGIAGVAAHAKSVPRLHGHTPDLMQRLDHPPVRCADNNNPSTERTDSPDRPAPSGRRPARRRCGPTSPAVRKSTTAARLISKNAALSCINSHSRLTSTTQAA